MRRSPQSIKLFEVEETDPLNLLNLKVNEIIAKLPATGSAAAAVASAGPIVEIKNFILEKLKQELQNSNPERVVHVIDPEIFSKAPASETSDAETCSLYLGIRTTTPRGAAAAAATASTTNKSTNICIDNTYETLSSGTAGQPRFKVKLSFLHKILDDYLYEKEISRYNVAWSRYKQQLIRYAKTIPGASISTEPDSLRSAIVSGLYARYQHFEEMGLGATWNGSFFKMPFHFAAENNIDRTLYILANYNNPWKSLGHSHTDEVRTLIRSLSPQLNEKKDALRGKTEGEQRAILNEADKIIFSRISQLYNHLSDRGETGSLMAKLQYLLLPYFIKHIEAYDRELYTNLQVPRATTAGILPLKFMVHVDPCVPAASAAAAPLPATAAAAAAAAAADLDHDPRWKSPFSS